MKQVGGRKLGDFTEQPIMNNIKLPDWKINFNLLNSLNYSPAKLSSFTVYF